MIPLPEGHPFPTEKYRQTKEALLARSIIETVFDPGLADEGDLALVHTSEYIRSVFEGELSAEQLRKLGFPWSKALVDRSRSAVAGTVSAMGAAIEEADGLGINLAGGTHHAFPDAGSGYCVFNDVAVAVKLLLSRKPSAKIMVADLDAHQGNGTHFILGGTRNVFTLSAHVKQNFPRNKHPGTLDIEFDRWIDGSEYLPAVEKALSESLARFSPDIVFYLAGVDVHENDRFGQMCLTEAETAGRDSLSITLFRKHSARVVIVLGGGYNKEKGMTARLHCQTIEIAADLIARG